MTPYSPTSRSKFTWSYQAIHTVPPSGDTASCGSSPFSVVSATGICVKLPPEELASFTWSAFES